MRVHHFYPRTDNIGDHFVQRGIAQMVREVRPGATFELFDINSRGREKAEYGLTQFAIERANSEADVVVVGGSNLYEGGFRWPWGIHLDPAAIDKLRVPLVLLGIGSGSNFGARLHRPSTRAKTEIKLLNEKAKLSGARDVITLEWLRQVGVAKAELTGDPATFIFNRAPQNSSGGPILIVLPSRRFWSSKRRLRVFVHGRAMFRALVSLTRRLRARGETVVVACNDPADLPLAESLFAGELKITFPETPDDYFELLSNSRAVVAGRLHTAVVAFSLGVPFLILNVDQRTHGFVKTYQLDRWSVGPSRDHIEQDLLEATANMLRHDNSWPAFIEQRDRMRARAMDLLKAALS